MDETITLALRHGVAPLLHRALQSGGALAGLPDQARARLEEARRATAFDNLRNYGEFRRIARALCEREIPLIALKGLHLAELVYRDISLRSMADLDILVPQPEVRRTVAALSTLDYEVNFGRPSGYDVRLTHRRLGILVEVHWTLGEPTEGYTPPMEEIWRMSLPTRVGGAEARVMSPEFLLLHVCVHLAYHHLFAFNLRSLCDIAEIAYAYPELDWALVAEQCGRHGWGRGVAAALRLAHDHLGAAVPEETLAAIGADTLDPELLADALEQLGTFATLPYELQFSPNLMALKSPIGWRAKLATLWTRIFVSHAELGQLYGVPERSARIGLYYAVRTRDLVRRYAASVLEASPPGPPLAATSARGARLAKWMHDA